MFNVKEYAKKYYLKNREKTRTRSKKWYSENKDKALSTSKKYVKKNKEKILFKKREYYEKNKEACLIRMKEWARNNKEKVKKYHKEYTIKNKDKIKAKKRIYQESHTEEHKARQRKYNKEKPHLKRARNNRYFTKKYSSNINFVKMARLRALFTQAFKRYSTTGKAYCSKKYGVDFQAICEYLGPCPGDRQNYRIHHIKELNTFNFDDPIQVKAAFAPENHEWVTIEKHEIIHDSKFV